jgi:hypothetical protein
MLGCARQRGSQAALSYDFAHSAGSIEAAE